ncbi:hypothetical protein C7C46_24855 [Streptomyces tateyamensis]|uniref:PknH-like extracellular domain-containing protein n=1 Tax=Streptomyces tateyamensis TaxID=565073 RepID=A0A2V4MX38_9ACTN|nr:hypothetical protein [Streptomyces tateyamensis]PYC74038.1 hypothetical protein C7C46_24855 [Streptomyces tateyamensis]
MSKLRISAAFVAVAATTALLAGCQSDKSDSPTAAPPAASQAPTSAAGGGSAPSASAGGSGAAGAVTPGSTLKTLLPSAATLPAGWKLDGTDGYEFDTKDTIQSPGTPLLPGEKCTDLTHSGADSLSIDFRAAYASIKLQDPKQGAVNVVIAAYHPGDAAKLLGEIRTLAGGCKSYSAPAMSGGNVQMTVSDDPVSGLGEESIDLKNTPQGHYVSEETVIARVGDKVLLLDASDAAGAMPDLKTLANQLAPKLK